MSIFNKKEKKLRKEFNKKNASFCRESVKELEELYDELKSSYEEIEIMDEFRQFSEWNLMNREFRFFGDLSKTYLLIQHIRIKKVKIFC